MCLSTKQHKHTKLPASYIASGYWAFCLASQQSSVSTLTTSSYPVYAAHMHTVILSGRLYPSGAYLLLLLYHLYYGRVQSPGIWRYPVSRYGFLAAWSVPGIYRDQEAWTSFTETRVQSSTHITCVTRLSTLRKIYERIKQSTYAGRSRRRQRLFLVFMRTKCKAALLRRLT